MHKKIVFIIFILGAGIPALALATAYCGFGGKCVSEWNQIKAEIKDGTITVSGPSRRTQAVSSDDNASSKDTNGVILKLFQNEYGNSDGAKIEFKKKLDNATGYYTSWTVGVLNQYDDFGISSLGDKRAGYGMPVFKITNYGSIGIGASYIPPSAALTTGDALRISGAVFRYKKGTDPQCSPAGIALMKRWGKTSCAKILPQKYKGNVNRGGSDEMVGCATTFGWAQDNPPFCTYYSCADLEYGYGGCSRFDLQAKCQSIHWDEVLCLEVQ